MISYGTALNIIEGEGTRRSDSCRIERLPLVDCVERRLAVDLDSLDNNPRFNNSAMDGFAVVSSETCQASVTTPLRLKVIACLAAGEAPDSLQSMPGSSLEIMTGAKLPDGPFDAVVRLEDVEQEHDEAGTLNSILLHSPVKAGDNIRYLGEDLRIGDSLLSKGTRIGPEHLLALAMAGHTSIDVFERVKVAVFSTGNEIVPFDSEKIEAHQIRNSTAPLLCSVLKLYGAEVSFYGIVSDDKASLRALIHEVLENKPNIIISTGGVSVGKFDQVEFVLKECGAKIHFHKVAVRPGKPALFAEFPPGDTVFFGLPGNPIAVAAATRFFVRPYLYALSREQREIPQKLALTQQVHKPAGLSFFQRGVRDGQGVKVLAGQGSAMVVALIKAEGWIVGDPDSNLLKQGELVGWYPLW